MRGISVDGTPDSFIQSTQEMILRFTAEVSTQAKHWTQQLIDCPDDLVGIERLVHNAYARGADLLIAGMMAATIKDGQVEDHQMGQTFLMSNPCDAPERSDVEWEEEKG